MSNQQIIMNYTLPPSYDDLQVLTRGILDNLPEEIQDKCGEDDIDIQIEDMVDETQEQELGLEDPFDLTVQFKSNKEIAPGVQRKTTSGNHVMVLYRRAILDAWCDLGDDLTTLLRQMIIEEMGRHFEISDDDIDEMIQRHHQGLL